jgi:hypothetical protein
LGTLGKLGGNLGTFTSFTLWQTTGIRPVCTAQVPAQVVLKLSIPRNCALRKEIRSQQLKVT